MKKQLLLVSILTSIILGGCQKTVHVTFEERQYYFDGVSIREEFFAVEDLTFSKSGYESSKGYRFYGTEGGNSFTERYFWKDKTPQELGYSGDGSSHARPTPGPNGYFASTTLDYHGNPSPSGGGGGGSCIEGTWVRTVCGGAYSATLTFSAGGSGSLSDYDCTGQCSRYVPFTWVDKGSYCTVTYGSGTLCGQAFNPTGGNQNYTCSGNTLVFGNTYTRQ
jgi:hypothetical protein